MSNDRDNVVSLGHRQLHAKRVSPEMMLRAALNDVLEGKRDEPQMLVLFVDPGAEFRLHYYQSGMSMKECAAACDLGNAYFKRMLGL